MQSNRIILGAIFCALAALSSNAGVRPTERDLHAVVATVGQILEQAEYTQHKLDASMGQQILDAYLESLDFNKLFFTQEDIDQIRSGYSSSLNDDILLGNLTPAKNIFAIFKQRVDERVAKIGELLKGRYRFDSDRTIILNRAKERWPANASEADGVWRDQVESGLLAAKLDATNIIPGPEVIVSRFREIQRQIDGQDDADVLRIFLEAVARKIVTSTIG